MNYRKTRGGILAPDYRLRKPRSSCGITMFPMDHGASFTPSGAGATDPNFASVVLLLHMDGTDASTTFTDNSTSAKTMTANGNAQIDTAQSQFGGASGLFDGTGDYLTTPDSADWDFGTGDFTVEMWIRPANLTQRGVLVNHGFDSNDIFTLHLLFDLSRGARCAINTGGLTQVDFEQGNNTGWSANTWYHVALVRFGNEWDIYRDGVSIASVTDADGLGSYTGSLFIGIDVNGSGNPYNGWIDDLRVTKGVARYTANFTPPTAAFPNS